MLYSSHSKRIADKFVYLKCSCLDDAVGNIHVSGEAYKGASKTPVLEWRKTAYSSQEIVAILLSTYEPEQMCVSQPINVSHNVSSMQGHCNITRILNVTIWVRGNTTVPRSAGFMLRIILAAKRESLLLTRKVIP